MKILFFFFIQVAYFGPKLSLLATASFSVLLSSLQFVSSSQLCRTKSKAMNSLMTSFAARFPARAEQVFCNRGRSFALFRPPRTHRTPRIVCMAVGTVPMKILIGILFCLKNLFIYYHFETCFSVGVD